ncbi:MAG: glycosyltransferase family 39 protein [Candidatus Schekmanbacteria bacterium]|nr:glycosyltransferase family 39 protein [Candidatus Schekmanbacteria bacterium]
MCRYPALAVFDPSPKTSRRLLLAIIAAGAVLRAIGLRWGLPYEFHPDETTIVTLGAGAAEGRLNPGWFIYPSLQIYEAAALGVIAHWLEASRDWVVFALRALVAAQGVATIPLVYVLGRRLWSRSAGLAAAAVLAGLGAAVLHAHYGVTDVPIGFLTLASTVVAIRAVDRGAYRLALYAAVLTGLAATTKYSAAPQLLIPLLAAWFATRAGGARRPRRVAATLLLVPVFAAVFVMGTPYAVLDHLTFREHLSLEAEWQLHAQAGAHMPAAEDLPLSRRGVGQIPLLLWSDLGPVALGVIVVGFIVAIAGPILRSRRPTAAAGALPAERERFAASWFPLLWTVVYLALLLPSAKVEQRYLVPIYPFLALFGGRGAVALAALLSSAWKQNQVTAGRLALAGVMAATLAWPGREAIKVDRLLARPDSRIAARQWILDHLPPGAGVACDFYAPPLSKSDGLRVLRSPFTIASQQLSWYCRHGYSHVVISSMTYNRFFQDPSLRFVPARAWYRRLGRAGKRLVAFPGEELGFHDPTIKVYRLTACSGDSLLPAGASSPNMRSDSTTQSPSPRAP